VLQHFETALAGQVQVEQDESRTGHTLAGIRPVDEIHGLFAIVHHMQKCRKRRRGDGFAEQIHVGPVVLYEQYRRGLRGNELRLGR
jgi:hypothetical protein